MDENGPLEAIAKELGIEIKQLNKIDDSDEKIDFMLKSIDKQIEDHKRKMLYNSRTAANTSKGVGQKTCNLLISLSSMATKEKKFMQGS